MEEGIMCRILVEVKIICSSKEGMKTRRRKRGKERKIKGRVGRGEDQ